MSSHFHEWLTLIVKWFHVITGVAWIGASFYFNWLENNLERHKNLRTGLAGNLWAIHGGGFYYLEKYKNAPPKLPETLHWFKWEAYFTWLSGFALLVIIYYWNATSFLADPRVSNLSPIILISIGIGSLILGWLIYDSLCRSPLIHRPKVFASLGFLLLTAAAWGLASVMAPRAAYIHVGAIIGTIMAANVFRVIIPSQKQLVSAATAGSEPDLRLGQNAGMRSRHNNYLTLPVLFIMISSHFPSTFAHQWNWIILAGISLAGAVVRHYFNIRHLPERKVWILPTAACIMVLTAILAMPPIKSPSLIGQEQTVPFVKIAGIFADRCLSCHATHTTDDVFLTAPNGVIFETPGQIVADAQVIRRRVVEVQDMPLANKTGMTEEERRLIGLWIDQGAKIQ